MEGKWLICTLKQLGPGVLLSWFLIVVVLLQVHPLCVFFLPALFLSNLLTPHPQYLEESAAHPPHTHGSIGTWNNL